jgi:hypothetical protein
MTTPKLEDFACLAQLALEALELTHEISAREQPQDECHGWAWSMVLYNQAGAEVIVGCPDPTFVPGQPRVGLGRFLVFYPQWDEADESVGMPGQYLTEPDEQEPDEHLSAPEAIKAALTWFVRDAVDSAYRAEIYCSGGARA